MTECLGDLMNKASLLLLFLFLTAVTGTLLVWTGGDGDDVTPTAPDAWFEVDPKTVDSVGMLTADTADSEAETAQVQLPEGLGDDLREEVNSAEEVLVMQVWDGKKGVPAVEASVFILDGFEGPDLKDPFARHLSELAETRGQRFKTDLQGRVELPAVQRWAIVTALQPGAFGFAIIKRRHREVETITLRVDETVTVRVIDGDNRPVADAPVGVVQHIPVREKTKEWANQYKQLEKTIANVEQYLRANPGEREGAMEKMRSLREQRARIGSQLRREKGGRDKNSKAKKSRSKKGKKAKSRSKQKERPINTRGELRARRRTDADGFAVFRHFQLYRHRTEKWWPSEHHNQFDATLLMPLREPESAAFAGHPVPTETLELRMPPTGSIVLVTVDRDSRPFTHPVKAELRMHAGETVPWTRLQVRKEQNEKSIVFPFVGLGLQFGAQCRLDDGDFRWSAPQFAGPTGAGEQLSVNLVVAPRAGMLFGRLLDVDGKPLAGARPTFLINSSTGRLEGEEVTLDTDGRFHLPYEVNKQTRGPFRFEIRRDDLHPTAGLAMTLPMLPAAHVTDLGELTIDAFGAIARGIVVDDRGEPIAGAMVQLQRQRNVGKNQRLAFVDEAFTVDKSDAEGQYELFGELEPARYGLRCEAGQHFPVESLDLRPDEPVVLTLQRKSRVVGTVLAPDWMPSRSIQVRLELVADPKQRRDDYIRNHEGKKYVYFDWVRPGIYNVQLRLQDFPDPFLRIDGLEILPGQQGVHPRLRDLDLGGYLFHFEIAAIDEQNRSIRPDRPLLARIVRPGGQTGFVGFPWDKKNNKVQIFNVSPQLEVWPMAAGYRSEPTVLGQGQSELRFLKIPPVELLLPGIRKLIGTTSMWVTLNQIGDSGLPRKLESWDQRSGRIAQWYGKGQRTYAKLGRGDSAQVQVTADGQYGVLAYIGNKSKGTSPMRVELGAINLRITPGAETQRVMLNYDVERVQAVVTALAQRAAANGTGR